jgi:hypothetical protein
LRTAPARLGELLEKHGQLTREQLLRALRNQKVLGGRLGTSLLEIEAITEEQLCSALAEQFGVPCATPEDLRGIPDDVLELIPAKVARRCQAIAFHASATQVKVALADARNLAHQDEISFVVGKRIRWHVAPELRLIEALEKHYGEECPSRLAKLLDRMNRSRFLWARESAASAANPARTAGDQLQWDSRIAGVASPAAEGSLDSAASVSVELPHFQHQTLELPALPPIAPVPAPTPALSGAAIAMPAPAVAAAPAPPAPKPAPPAAPVAPPPSPVAPSPAPPPTVRRSVEETEQRLLQPRERDDVARALLDFGAGLRRRAVLFVIRKDEVAPWFWAGAGLDTGKLAALRLSLKQPSLFEGLKSGNALFRGAPLPLPAHVALAAAFTSPPLAREILVLPVRVKERLVAALLLEPQADGLPDLAAEDLANLHRVIAKAEIAFELCIMQAKLRKA